MPIMFIRHCKTIFNHYHIWAPDNHLWEVVTFDPEGHYKWFRGEDEAHYEGFAMDVIGPLIESRAYSKLGVFASDSDRVRLSIAILKDCISDTFDKVTYSPSLRERYGGPYVGLPLSRYYDDEELGILLYGVESHQEHRDRVEHYLHMLPSSDAKLWELALGSPHHLLICVGHAFTNAVIERLIGVDDVSPQDNFEVRLLTRNSLDNSLMEETINAAGQTKSRTICPSERITDTFTFG